MSTNIVSSTAANALQERWERLRSHKRIISRVKLLVEWDQGGAKETANAVTVDVSHSGCMAVVGADRKSTRLNSSHVEISYAVFCLKTKSTNGSAPRPRASTISSCACATRLTRTPRGRRHTRRPDSASARAPTARSGIARERSPTDL